MGPTSFSRYNTVSMLRYDHNLAYNNKLLVSHKTGHSWTHSVPHTPSSIRSRTEGGAELILSLTHTQPQVGTHTRSMCGEISLKMYNARAM